MQSHFTESAEKALLSAEKQAGLFGHTYIGSEHLLLGLIASEGSTASHILLSKGLSHRRLAEAVGEYAGLGSPTVPHASDMTPTARRIIENAKKKTALDASLTIGSEHLLLALLEEPESVAARIILRENVSVAEMRGEIMTFLTSGAAKGEKKSPSHTLLTTLPHLSAYGKDLTLLAEEGKLDPVIGRAAETERCIRILTRKQKNNPCLLGDPGVGKTAVVEGLAQAIAERRVPEPLQKTRLVSLDLSAMIAGAKYRGEFEERMRGVLEELSNHPEILLFIDEIHILNGAGAAEGAIDAASILKPPLSRGEIRLIGATTREEYRRHIEKDAALERRFQPIDLYEPSEEEAIAILRGVRPRYEKHHGIHIADEALVAAVTLSARYIPDRFLPDKALDLLDEAAAAKRIFSEELPQECRALLQKAEQAAKEREKAILARDPAKALKAQIAESDAKKALEAKKAAVAQQNRKTPPRLVESDIRAVLSEISGIPLPQKNQGEKQRLSLLRERLLAKVIGQDAAVEAVTAALMRRAAGLSDKNRPTGSFLFLGPTGVGKTALALELGRALFPEKDACIRIDMSEYMEAGSVSRLVGASPGYVGYEDGARLTLAVRKHPYSLLLFDEVEKAHKDVLNLLLQILDDGALTDAEGRKTDFRNTVIILTSNLVPKSNGSIGFLSQSTKESDRRRLEAGLSGFFRPELLNRIDEIVLFQELSIHNMDKIAYSMLEDLKSSCLKNGLSVRFSEKIAPYIAACAAEEKSGARPLRRLIDSLLRERLSAILLDGICAVSVDLEGGVLSFSPEEEAIHPYLKLETEIEA